MNRHADTHKDTMIRTQRTFFILVFLLFALMCRAGEPASRGKYRCFGIFKHRVNYSPEEYGGHFQNWGILRDNRGILYFANQSGLVIYDGAIWERLNIKNNTARSIALAPDGTIYVGGNNEIGYMKPDKNAKPGYVSLKPLLDENIREFGWVFETHCAAGSTWFWAPPKLFRLTKGAITNEGEFRGVFSLDGKFYMQKKGEGILEANGESDSYRLLPGSKSIADDRICMAVPYGDKKLLLGLRYKDFYIYDGTNVVPFQSEVNDYIKGKKLYTGIRLSSGDFAAATLTGGLVVFDAQGRLKCVFNRETSGLRDQKVKYVFEDPQGSLWLALNNGIARIDYGSPSLVMDDRFGLPGVVISVVRHNERLYAGTDSGLYYMIPTPIGTPQRFRQVPGVSGNCWDLEATAEGILAATDHGVWWVPETGAPLAADIKTICYVLTLSRAAPGRVWAATDTGITALIRNKNTWKEEHVIEIPKQGILSAVEDPGGNLWLGTQAKGVIKVNIPDPGNLSRSDIRWQVEKDNLPAGEVYVTRVDGRVVFATSRGIYRYESAAHKFFPDPVLGDDFKSGERRVFRIDQVPSGHIWFRSERETYYTSTGPGPVTVTRVVFPMNAHTQVNAIYPEGRVVWFPSAEGLAAYDMGGTGTCTAPPRQEFNTLVRRVTLKNGEAPYEGHGKGQEQGAVAPTLLLEYRDRHLRFDTSATYYEGLGDMMYRYLLEGFDEQWSKWTSLNFIRYNNLGFGKYTFRVEAKNAYGTVGREDRFSFRIFPPWYFTGWAYLLYAALALVSVSLVVRWRSHQLLKEKARLEGVVEERTHEINAANAQLRQKTVLLEEQSEQLKELDEAKSRFFANISHEFRTPLSLIMGPLDQIRTESPDPIVTKRIDLAYRNSLRLMSLINQLLDISKLESGKMKLQAEEADLVGFLKALAEPFQLAAERQQLELVLDFPAEPVPIYFDGEKLEKIINNLLSNAVKFTPPGGRITIAVTPSQGNANIVVKDTGIGIAPEQLGHIFDRFYQAETTVEYRQKGSGIGLALARELVELHYGEIDVTSSLGGDGQEDSGTTFTVRLPLGCEHLSAAEIASGDTEPDAGREPEPAAPSIAVDMLETVDALEAGEQTNGLKKGTGEAGEIILVVEDNADLRYYIRSSLEPDYRVEEAANGREGIEIARKIIPDLIISDIMMPEADGYQLCQTVKGEISTSHIPVILLTARASEQSILKGLESGADDYITKPFNTHVLCARVRNLIDLRRQLQLNLNREMVMQPNSISVSKMDREFLEDLRQVIDKNLSDPEFNVEDLSRRLYMSRTTVYRKIQALSGETPTDFIRTYRLKRAAQLLQGNFGSVTEVAFEVGFSSRAYFTKCFKEKFQRLPSEYPS